MLMYGVILTLPCISMLLWPGRHASKVEERIKEGNDQYFEEQRAYRSYPFLRDVKRIRLAGAVGTVCGLTFCAIQLYQS
jgi:hypothetical protein